MQLNPKINLKFFANIASQIASILIEVDGKRILIDPGRHEGRTHANEVLPGYELEKLDAIVITHYHGDHSNLLDEILGTGKFNGPIISHSATADIIQTYYEIDKKANAQFIRLNYGEKFALFGDNFLTLYDAGHVLGSSIVCLKSGAKVIVITGDLGAGFLPIVREPTTSFPVESIDLLITEAKQAWQHREINLRTTPLGDIIYRKLQDCFLFDDGNVLIYAPLVQVPVLLYCLNYIFNNQNYFDVHSKVNAVYLDPQPKLLKLLEIFHSYEHLLDSHDKEYVIQDGHHFSFKKLTKALPPTDHLRRSIFITPNHAVFVKYFKHFKQSVKNDVLLLNQNIYSVLNRNIGLIDKHCDMQIKRLPFLHYHPDRNEMTNWLKEIKKSINVKRILFYHYNSRHVADNVRQNMKHAIGGNIYLAHRLTNDTIVI